MFQAKRRIKVVGFSLIALAGLRAAAPASLFRDLPLDRALALAAEEKRLVFIDFYTEKCGACARLDQTTWKDTRVVALLRERTIPLKIDAGAQAVLRRQYQVDVYPTLLLLKPDGTIQERIVGYQPPEPFLASVQHALTAHDPLPAAREAVALAGTRNLKNQIAARFRLAQILVQRDLGPEGLTELLWLYDFGTNREGYAQVRCSVASELEYLSLRFPPAEEALKLRRAGARKAFLARPTLGTALQFKSLFQAPAWPLAALEAFDQVGAASSVRMLLSPWVWDELVRRRRYTEAVALRPFQAFQKETAGYGAGSLGLKDDPEATQANSKYYLSITASEIEVLAGGGDLADAATLVNQALAVDGSRGTQALLKAHLERAGHPELLVRVP